MTDLSIKINNAVETLRRLEPSNGYYLCYSGGKDSDCVRILAIIAGVKFDLVHNLTTVDAPETVRYVRSIPGVTISYPDTTMWRLIVQKRFPPTRTVRYCCSFFKERGGLGRLKLTGVRRAESASRAKYGGLIKIIGSPKRTQSLADDLDVQYRVNHLNGLVLETDDSPSRRLVEMCYRTRNTTVNPIIDWSENDVWEFLRYYGCDGNPLYRCGKKRVGCIGCPMQSSRGMLRDFANYPKYRDNYVRAFDRLVIALRSDGKQLGTWQCGEDVYRWWVGLDPLQITLDDYSAILANGEGDIY